MLLATLKELGAELETTWARVRHQETFTSMAYRILASASLPPFSWHEVERYAIRTGNHSEFGDLNLMAYRSEEFWVEVLVWGSGSPDIHSHSFSGAFRVVAGGSVHAAYSVDRVHWSSPRLVVGEIAFRGLSVLRVGDTYPIEPGIGFLHGLYHWHHPSVTVVVRTKRDADHPYQFGLSNPIASPQILTAGAEIAADPQLRGFRSLARLRPWPEVERVLLAAIDELPTWRLWAVYVEFGSRLGVATRQAVLEALPVVLVETQTAIRPRSLLRQARSLLRTDAARIAAGMSLLAPSRAHLLVALEQAFPGEDPAAVFTRGAVDLFGALMSGEDGECLAEVLVRDVLAGRGLEDSLGTLREAFADDSIADHEQHIRACRDVVVSHLGRFAAPTAHPHAAPKQVSGPEGARTPP